MQAIAVRAGAMVNDRLTPVGKATLGGKVPLLIEPAPNHDGGVGLGARAFHVEPLVAHRDLVAAQDAHALEAA